MNIKLIVGIGNIGTQYVNTRHNFGHYYIQLLSKKYHVDLKYNNKLHGYIGVLKIFKWKVKLLIPNSYINQSGLSVSKCIDFYRLSLQEVLVVHDELDLIPGNIKIKLGKRVYESHNGIQDIINKLNNNFNFYRLRIGIGRPKNRNEIVNFVLSSPSIIESNKIDYILRKTLLYTEDLILSNFDNFMNKLYSNKNIY